MIGYLEALRSTGYHMSFPDYWKTNAVIKHADALISTLSTIIVEAALAGVPPMCFMPLDEDDSYDLEMQHNMPHFEDIYKMPEFIKTRSLGDLVKDSKELLARAEDPSFAERLREVSKFFVEPFDRPWGERLVEFVKSVPR